MGESGRHQNPASVSLTLPEEPPHFQASKEPAPSLPSLPNGNIKGCPALALPWSCTGRQRRKDPRQYRARFSEPLARRGLRTGCSLRRRRGTKAERRDRSPEPRDAGERAVAAAPRVASGRSPRPRSRASSSARSPGCWAADAGEPGMGAGAARPSIAAAAADPGSSTRPSRLRPVDHSSLAETPGRGRKKKKGQNPERLVLTAKPWGARAVPLLHASAAAAGPAPRGDVTGSPSGASGCGMEAAPGTGWDAGPPGMPPGASAARPSRGARDARANNTASCRGPAPPPPRETLHNRARGPAPAAGGAAGRSPPGLATFPRS